MPNPLPVPNTPGKTNEDGGNEGGVGAEVCGRAVSKIGLMESEVQEMYRVVAALRANAEKASFFFFFCQIFFVRLGCRD